MTKAEFLALIDDSWEIMTEADKEQFMQEYKIELQDHHPLWGIEIEPLVSCLGSDDYMTLLPDGRVAIVHLTWTSKPQSIGFPTVEWCDNLTKAAEHFGE